MMDQLFTKEIRADIVILQIELLCLVLCDTNIWFFQCTLSGRVTITRRDGGTSLGQRYGLSVKDVQQANLLYCGSNPLTNMPPTRPPIRPPTGKLFCSICSFFTLSELFSISNRKTLLPPFQFQLLPYIHLKFVEQLLSM